MVFRGIVQQGGADHVGVAHAVVRDDPDGHPEQVVRYGSRSRRSAACSRPAAPARPPSACGPLPARTRLRREPVPQARLAIGRGDRVQRHRGHEPLPVAVHDLSLAHRQPAMPAMSAGCGSKGRKMANRVRPGRLVTVMLPPCAATTASTMARPRPVLVPAARPPGHGTCRPGKRSNSSAAVRRDAGTVVGDAQLHLGTGWPHAPRTSRSPPRRTGSPAARRPGGQGHADRRAGRGVLARVAHQVGQHLVQPVLVAADQDRFAGQVQAPVMITAGHARVAGHVNGQPGQVHGLPLERAPGVQPGQQQQVVDQDAHPGRPDSTRPSAWVTSSGTGPGCRRASSAYPRMADSGVRAARGWRRPRQPAQPGPAGRPAAQGPLDVVEHPVQCPPPPGRPRSAGRCRARPSGSATSPESSGSSVTLVAVAATRRSGRSENCTRTTPRMTAQRAGGRRTSTCSVSST